MAIHVMLTVDLNNHVSSDARSDFYKAIESEGFKRMKLTTTWSGHFPANFTRNQAQQWIRDCLERASSQSGVTYYEMGYMLSDAPMVEGNSLTNALLKGLLTS